MNAIAQTGATLRQSGLRVSGDITVNSDIPLGSIEPWRTAAIQKVIALGNLTNNWDARGSAAPSRAARTAAIDFLMQVPSVGAPRIVPVSGGELHFEWIHGDRELEISLDSTGRFEALKVENGMPIEDEQLVDMAALFSWLISK